MCEITHQVNRPYCHSTKAIKKGVKRTGQQNNTKLIAGSSGVEPKEILDIDYSYRKLNIRSHRYDYPIYEAGMMTTHDAAPDFVPDDVDVTETVTIA